jgi:hypothetical protein
MPPSRLFAHLLVPVAALLGAGAPASARGAVVYAGGAWAAIDRGGTCEALSRSVRIAAKGKVQAQAGFAFSADRRRWGEFHALLRRMPRADAAVMLRIDNQPFLLVSRANWAWSTGPLQERAIIAALRGANGMSIESRDAAGRSFIDPYSLDGAATAIDAAAAACAGKSR